jgi:hypothetical protein
MHRCLHSSITPTDVHVQVTTHDATLLAIPSYQLYHVGNHIGFDIFSRSTSNRL